MRIWWLGLGVACVTDAEVDRALDRDGDGFRTAEAGGRDCDDSSAAIFPGAPEQCGDGIDNNCDGAVDDFGLDDAPWFEDADGDGAGRDDRVRRACPGSQALAAGGWSLVGGDCDDTDATVGPGAFEACDGVDNDCDSVVDEIVAAATTPDGTRYATVDEGVAAALSSGLPLGVCEGTHDVSTVFVENGEELELIGVGSERAILVGPPSGRFVDASGGSVRLAGVTIRGATVGTAIHASGSTQLTIEGCEIRDAETGVHLEDEVVATFVGGGLVANGSGTPGSGGLVVTGGTVTLDGVVLRSNHGLDGGGASVTGGAVTILASQFVDNQADRGGGLYADLPPGEELSIDGTSFQVNHAGSGGGIFVAGLASLRDTAITDQTATIGAGLYVAGGVVTLDGRCEVRRNVATDRSGAAHVALGSLVIEGANFGVGTTNNFPEDIRSADGSTSTSLGTEAWATCTNTGCSP